MSALLLLLGLARSSAWICAAHNPRMVQVPMPAAASPSLLRPNGQPGNSMGQHGSNTWPVVPEGVVGMRGADSDGGVSVLQRLQHAARSLLQNSFGPGFNSGFGAGAFR